MDIGLDKYGQGVGNYISTGTYFDPTLYRNPTIEGRNAALIGRGGIFAGGQWHEFDQARVREDVTHSFYEGSRPLHPFEGETIPIDPEKAKKQGKYSWAKSPALRDRRDRPPAAGDRAAGPPDGRRRPERRRRTRTTTRCSSTSTTRSAPAC